MQFKTKSLLIVVRCDVRLRILHVISHHLLQFHTIPLAAPKNPCSSKAFLAQENALDFDSISKGQGNKPGIGLPFHS